MTTILSLLQNSVQSSPIGSGKEADVFDLCDKRLRGYILRVKNGTTNLNNLREDSTANIPTDRFNGKNFGQRIFLGDWFSINLRQPGQYSWDDLFKLFSKSFDDPELIASKLAEISEELSNIDTEHYIRLIKDAKFLHSIGEPLDYGGANIKFDQNGFGLLDVEGNNGSNLDCSFYSLAGLLLRVSPTMITNDKFSNQRERAYRSQAQVLMKLLDAAEREKLYLGVVYMEKFYRDIFINAGINEQDTTALLERIKALENNTPIEEQHSKTVEPIRTPVRLNQSVEDLCSKLGN